MSYCRWSSNDWDCDVYVYADYYGGWVTHVAGNRLVVDRDTWPDPVSLPSSPVEDDPNFQPWIDRYRFVLDAVSNADRAPIGLPHDGESFNDDTPGQCAQRLEGLRGMGYHVPQNAIDALKEEDEELRREEAECPPPAN